MPAGRVFIVYITKDLADYAIANVPIDRLTDMHIPKDPEPEYADMNNNNVVAVTLQKKKGIFLVQLTTKIVQISSSIDTVELYNSDPT